MTWALITVTVVSFGLAAIMLYISNHLRSKAKHGNRQVGYRREEIQIDLANVPEFKPTWRDRR